MRALRPLPPGEQVGLSGPLSVELSLLSLFAINRGRPEFGLSGLSGEAGA